MTATGTLSPTTATGSQSAGSWGTTTGATTAATGDQAVWTSTASGATGTLELSGYGAQAAIGSQPISIDSVDVFVRSWETGATARMASVTVQLFSGASAIGTTTALTITLTTSNSQTVNLTGTKCPTWAQAADLRARVVFTRAAVTTACTGNVDYVSVVLNYTPQPHAGAITATGAVTGASTGKRSVAFTSGTGAVTSASTGERTVGAIAATGAVTSASTGQRNAASTSGTGTVTTASTGRRTVVSSLVTGTAQDATITTTSGTLAPATPALASGLASPGTTADTATSAAAGGVAQTWGPSIIIVPVVDVTPDAALVSGLAADGHIPNPNDLAVTPDIASATGSVGLVYAIERTRVTPALGSGTALGVFQGTDEQKLALATPALITVATVDDQSAIGSGYSSRAWFADYNRNL